MREDSIREEPEGINTQVLGAEATFDFALVEDIVGGPGGVGEFGVTAEGAEEHLATMLEEVEDE